MRKLGILAALALTVTFVVVLAAGPAASGNGTTPSTTVVMTGLNNPRGLALGPGGWLHVAEAGSGGAGPCTTIRGVNQCFGATGSVSRWKQGRSQQRVATGLPSYAPQVSPPPDGATGPHDIEFDDGKAFITLGVGGDPRVIRAAFGNTGFGWLARMNRNGGWSLKTDIAAHEVAANPDGAAIDSNPYGLLVDDSKKYVAEAGGNALLRVRNSSINTVAAFPPQSQPPPPRESVPTEVIEGPSGSLLVSELRGGPFFPGTATIWRVGRTGPPTPYLTGFKAIIDMDWSCDGTHLYVLQFSADPTPGLAPPGALIKVNPRTNERTQVAGPELVAPTSVLVDCRDKDKGHFRFADDDDDDDDGDRGKKSRRDVLYVSNKGTLPAVGEVLRLVR